MGTAGNHDRSVQKEVGDKKGLFFADGPQGNIEADLQPSSGDFVYHIDYDGLKRLARGH